MISRSSQSRELFARHGTQRDSSAAAELCNLLNARIAASGRDGHVVEPTLACQESFFYSMNAKDNHQRVKATCDSSVAAIGNAHKWRQEIPDIQSFHRSLLFFCRQKFQRHVEFAIMAFRITAETNSGDYSCSTKG